MFSLIIYIITVWYEIYITDDGSVQVWRDYDTEKPSLVTAWRALTDMLPTSKKSKFGGLARSTRMDIEHMWCGRQWYGQRDYC